jgi:hypothetical protein
LRPESDAPDVFQSLKWFNVEDPDGHQAYFRVEQQMQKTNAQAAKKVTRQNLVPVSVL